MCLFSFLFKDSYPSIPNGLINLIHYDDAAECVITAFDKKVKNQVFLVSDGVPISRTDICKAGLVNPDFAGKKEPKFEGDASVIDGKKYDTTKAKSELGFQAKFKDFASFMAEGYKMEKPCDLLQ